MSENMKLADNVIEILDYIFKKLGIAFDWTTDSVIPIINKALEKFVAWKTGEYIFWICFGVIFILVGAVLTSIAFNESKRDEWGEGLVMTAIVGVILIIIGFIVGTANAYNLIKLLTIPELKFYEWATQYISQYSR